MTLIEAIDVARSLINEPLASTRTFPDNTSSFFTDTVLQGYFNHIQEEVQGDIEQSFEDYFLTQSFLSITAGCADYSIPSGTIKIRRVEDVRNATNPIEIVPVTLNNKYLGGISEVYSQVGVGNAYYIVGNRIILTETPTYSNASAIQLHRTKRLPDVTAGSNTSELPPEHHGILVWGVVKMALFQQQSDITLASLEYEKRLTKLRRFVENRQVQRPRKVNSTYGDV